MQRLTWLKSLGAMMMGVLMLGCAHEPDNQAKMSTPQAVEIAKNDTVTLSAANPIGVMKANYATAAVDKIETIDNKACSAVDFCPLPIRKPKAAVID